MIMLMAKRILEGFGAPLSQITKMGEAYLRTLCRTFDTLN